MPGEAAISSSSSRANARRRRRSRRKPRIIRPDRKPRIIRPRRHTAERQAEPQPSRPAPIRRRNRDEAPDPANLPTLAQLQAEIRRWGIGQAIADICRDLGVSFCLCDWRFAVPLGNVITWYGADQGRLVLDFHRREAALDPELDGTPPLRLPEQTREATRRMLGFLIGDRWPVRPSWVPAPPRVPTPPALCAPAATRPP